MSPEAQAALHVAIAALGGAAIGIERQWSGHATGPRPRFGGVRTFTLLGGLAGVAGLCWALQAPAIGAVLAAAAAALVAAAYWKLEREDIEATTEVAAMVVIAAGVLAGAGRLVLASGIVAVTALLLVEKTRLHKAVAKLDRREVRAAAQFAVMAVVILPLLPEGPFGPLGGIRPRQLWMLVLFFSGLSYFGFLARRIVGEKQGYFVAGLIGGLVSSTSVTLTFSRLSREHREAGRQLAFGILAACALLYVRVAVAAGVLNVDLMTQTLPYLAAPFLVTVALVFVGWKRSQRDDAKMPEPRNPLQLKHALQMAALFQVVLFAVHGVRAIWGDAGLLVTGAILGLTDLDALTISMARLAEDPTTLILAAQAIAVGVLSNTVFKMGAAVLLGRGAVRTIAAGGLLLGAAASAASLLLLPR